MLLINLFGAPGAGKSTMAAYVFSQLKMAGVNAELVTEFAKDKVWEDAKAPFENQLYIFAEQYYRITRCEEKVDVIVTDSPLLLSLIYHKDDRLGEEFNTLVKKISKDFDSLNFYLQRVKDYNPIGRFQTEKESDEIADKVKDMLDTEKVPYFKVQGNELGANIVISCIMDKIGDEKTELGKFVKNKRENKCQQ